MEALTFIQTAAFVGAFRRWRLDDDDLRALERMLMENPAAGRVMALQVEFGRFGSLRHPEDGGRAAR